MHGVLHEAQNMFYVQVCILELFGVIISASWLKTTN